ncbi:MAG: hypothetical protein LAP87_22250 [Acidobacteriia bacterium]|nr:hypothetical protein [Terriglobia bacterium]
MRIALCSGLAAILTLPLLADQIAFPMDYQIHFAVDAVISPQGMLPEQAAVPTGSFTYDPGTDLFSAFTVSIGPVAFDLTTAANSYGPFAVIQQGPCAGVASPIFALLSQSAPAGCSAPQPGFPAGQYGIDLPPITHDYYWEFFQDQADIFRFVLGPWENGPLDFTLHGNVMLQEGFLPGGPGRPPGEVGYPGFGHARGSFSISETSVPEPGTTTYLLLQLSVLAVVLLIKRVRSRTGSAPLSVDWLRR